MANEANFSIRAKGSLKNLQEFFAMLIYEHPEKLSFYRIFNVGSALFRQTDDKDWVLKTSGDCAHDIYTAMFCEHEESLEYNLTTAQEVSKSLNISIQVYSIEYQDNLEEHFYVESGEIIIDENNTFELYYDDDGKEYGNGPEMKIDWKF